ncbi:hypothetical protein D3C85_576700 [compost metagenome]
MGLFSRPELKVRLNEEVGFAGPIFYSIQVKGGEYSRFFWVSLPKTPVMQHSEAYATAINFALKHKCRFIPR